MMKNYDEDEEKDKKLLQEALDKNKDYASAAKWLSSRLATKYSSEFGGTLSLEYDMVDSKFIIKYGKKAHVLQEEELNELPATLKFLRKSSKKN